LTDGTPLSGYANPSYAASLAEFGTPRLLPRSGSWVLERDIPCAGARDAMGCYPLFFCHDWRGLEPDLQDLDELVCLSVVTDPFGAYDEQYLRRCFGDMVIPFKHHFVTELSRSTKTIVSRHHRYYAQRALARLLVERCSEPERLVVDWSELYSHLIARHDLKGIKAFSQTAFAAQLRIPGIVMLRASYEGQTVGAHLWYLHGEIAYSHLAAFNPVGYELMASYALHWFAMQTFSGQVRWLSLGSGPGLTDQDGRQIHEPPTYAVEFSITRSIKRFSARTQPTRPAIFLPIVMVN
jgi:hypothetical protein